MTTAQRGGVTMATAAAVRRGLTFATEGAWLGGVTIAARAWLRGRDYVTIATGAWL